LPRKGPGSLKIFCEVLRAVFDRGQASIADLIENKSGTCPVSSVNPGMTARSAGAHSEEIGPDRSVKGKFVSRTLKRQFVSRKRKHSLIEDEHVFSMTALSGAHSEDTDLDRRIKGKFVSRKHKGKFVSRKHKGKFISKKRKHNLIVARKTAALDSPKTATFYFKR
jgi:predicted acetyltransferase